MLECNVAQLLHYTTDTACRHKQLTCFAIPACVPCKKTCFSCREARQRLSLLQQGHRALTGSQVTYASCMLKNSLLAPSDPNMCLVQKDFATTTLAGCNRSRLSGHSKNIDFCRNSLPELPSQHVFGARRCCALARWPTRSFCCCGSCAAC